jgi:hypothetical protein
MVHTMNFTPPKAGLLSAKRLALARRTHGKIAACSTREHNPGAMLNAASLRSDRR